MEESFGIGQKMLRHQNRYRNLILVSIADTETRFQSYTTSMIKCKYIRLQESSNPIVCSKCIELLDRARYLGAKCNITPQNNFKILSIFSREKTNHTNFLVEPIEKTFFYYNRLFNLHLDF